MTSEEECDAWDTHFKNPWWNGLQERSLHYYWRAYPIASPKQVLRGVAQLLLRSVCLESNRYIRNGNQFQAYLIVISVIHTEMGLWGFHFAVAVADSARQQQGFPIVAFPAFSLPLIPEIPCPLPVLFNVMAIDEL